MELAFRLKTKQTKNTQEQRKRHMYWLLKTSGYQEDCSQSPSAMTDDDLIACIFCAPMFPQLHQTFQLHKR
jgi:hypothetical protein